MVPPWLQEAIGSAAGFLTTVAFVPQVLKTWRTRSTRDISLAMWVTFWLGVALWTVYGAIIGSWPMMIANTITLVLAGTVLVLKLANRGRE